MTCTRSIGNWSDRLIDNCGVGLRLEDCPCLARVRLRSGDVPARVPPRARVVRTTCLFGTGSRTGCASDGAEFPEVLGRSCWVRCRGRARGVLSAPTTFSLSPSGSELVIYESLQGLGRVVLTPTFQRLVGDLCCLVLACPRLSLHRT